MNSILNQQRRSSIAAAAVTILLGLFLAFWPGQSVSFLCMLLGAAIAVTGIIYFVGWLARRREGVPALFVLPGVVLFALGAWLMTSPASVVQLVQYIFGAVLIFHGVVDLQGALALGGSAPGRPHVRAGRAGGGQPLRHLCRPDGPGGRVPHLRRRDRPGHHLETEPGV